jgi:hypothetical protein
VRFFLRRVLSLLFVFFSTATVVFFGLAGLLLLAKVSKETGAAFPSVFRFVYLTAFSCAAVTGVLFLCKASHSSIKQ